MAFALLIFQKQTQKIHLKQHQTKIQLKENKYTVQQQIKRVKKNKILIFLFSSLDIFSPYFVTLLLFQMLKIGVGKICFIVVCKLCR